MALITLWVTVSFKMTALPTVTHLSEKKKDRVTTRFAEIDLLSFKQIIHTDSSFYYNNFRLKIFMIYHLVAEKLHTFLQLKYANDIRRKL